MKNFFIYGASGHGKVVLDTLIGNDVNFVAFVDDNEQLTSFQGYPVVKSLPNESEYIIAIGDNFIRKSIQTNCVSSQLVNVIHPNAVISKSTILGDGTLVGVNSILNANSIVGSNCIINSAATIEHDCVIKDHVHISPNATICGNVILGEGTHVGAGAVVLPNLSIGKWVTIGAGTVVINDLPDGVTAVGNPARIIKTRNV